MASPVTPRQDDPVPPPPSATYQRLRHYIAERMRMSHVYQPLMLMELLGQGVAWQDAARPRHRGRCPADPHRVVGKARSAVATTRHRP